MATPYSGNYDNEYKGMKEIYALTQELEDLRKKAEAGDIPQEQYVNRARELIPTIENEAYAQRRISDIYNAANGGKLKEINEALKKANIYSSARELLGRDLTANEYAEIVPRFGSYSAGEKGGREALETGRAYLAELAKQEAKSPAALAKKAPQYASQIGGYYQSLLNRGATPEEADYFGRLIATGQVTPYEIQEFIKATPEFQTGEDKKFRESLSGELAGYDEKAFGRERENILSQYTKAGLQNSSALDFAITDALGKLQEQRGQFLGGLSAQQYGGNKDAARQDYLRSLGQYEEGRQYGRGRSDAYLDYLTQRSDASKDYARQREDYLQFLAQQPKQSGGGGWGGLAGGLLGAGIGAFTGTGPAGVTAGYQIGSGLGGTYDYLR